jgi:hypothetical protein
LTWHQKWGGALALWDGGHLTVSKQKIGVPFPYEWCVWGKTDCYSFAIINKGYSSSIDDAKMEAEIALQQHQSGLLKNEQ